MAEFKIDVITYEQSRLAYFKELQNRQKKRFEQFEKSSALKELSPQEKHCQLSQMGEILQYYDDIVKMLEQPTTADVMEVVRCKDCKYRETVGCPMYYEENIEWDDDGYTECDTIIHDNTTDYNFCSYGERSETE